jgi:hypothetical protein
LRILDAEDRVSAAEFEEIARRKRGSYLLIDVRPPLEMAICSLPDSLNVPFEILDEGPTLDRLRQLVAQRRDDWTQDAPLPGTFHVSVTCRSNLDE